MKKLWLATVITACATSTALANNQTTQSLEQNIISSPGETGAYLALAQQAEENGETAKAINAYSQALETDPKNKDIKMNLGLLYAKEGRRTEAKMLFARAKENRTEQEIILAQAEIPKSPEEEQESNLRKKMSEDKENLDSYFEYAKLMQSQGKLKEAAGAYEYMLKQNPNLDRIKLDLALIYLTDKRYQEAKTLFTEVLEKNPPEQVKTNIAQMLAKIEQDTKIHTYGGSVTLGFNHDSNANSAAGAGEIVFNDTPIQLPTDSKRQSDGHMFVAISGNHSYRMTKPEEDYQANWDSSLTIYRTEQAQLDNLDLKLISLKMGPTIKLPALKTEFNISGVMSNVELDRESYLKTNSLDMTGKYFLTERLFLDGQLIFEHKKHHNSKKAATNTDRNGDATQLKLAATYILTPEDIINGSVVLRREKTRRRYQDYDQANLQASYTRVLPYDMFGNVIAGYKVSNYDAADPLVSANVRDDIERSVTVLGGKKLPFGLTVTLSYQFRNVSSNIINFDYHNHRVASTLSYAF